MSNPTQLPVSDIDTTLLRNSRVKAERNDDPDFKILCDSIQEHGMLEPVCVYKLAQPFGNPPRNHGLAFGFRRIQAAQKIGMVTVPVVYVGATEAIKVNAVENGVRKNLHWVEQAKQTEDLSKIPGLEMKEVARLMGVAPSTASHYKRLAAAPFFQAAWNAVGSRKELPSAADCLEIISTNEKPDEQLAHFELLLLRANPEPEPNKPAAGKKGKKGAVAVANETKIRGKRAVNDMHTALKSAAKEAASEKEKEKYAFAASCLAWCVLARKNPPDGVTLEERKKGRKPKQAAE